MSGHSKWANIKHRKAAQDSKKGKVFTRIAKEITIAAREGGGDIDANARLRLAALNARAVNMPSENIKRAIQKGTGEVEGVNYEEITYEGYAPNGVAVMVETVTDNRKRTFSEIRTIFGKHGGNLGEANSVAWNFERKGVFGIENGGKSEDELFETILEIGADDLEYNDDVSRVICRMEDFANCNKAIDEKGLKIVEAKLEYIAKNVVSLTELNDARRVMKFVDVLEDNDDVQNVFANWETSDDIMEKLSAE